MALFRIWNSPGTHFRRIPEPGTHVSQQAIRKQALASSELIHQLTGLVFASLTVAVVHLCLRCVKRAKTRDLQVSRPCHGRISSPCLPISGQVAWRAVREWE